MSYLLARDAKFPWNFHNHMFFFNDNGVFHTEKNQARGGRGGGGGFKIVNFQGTERNSMWNFQELV